MSKYLVGIPTLNGPERLHRCLQSVMIHTPLDEVLVLVSDDGSTAENLARNKSVVHNFGVEILMTGDLRLGIAAQWNRLVRHCDEAQTIVLINDDIEVVPNWFDALVYSVEQNPEVGVVSLRCLTGAIKPTTPEPYIDYVESRLLDGDGTLLSAGGACFAFLRSSWKVVGGFDERYFVFYEEVDFSVSLARAGRFNYFASDPVVYHLGGATNSDPRNLPAASHLALSRQRFAEKWGTTPAELRQEFAMRQRPSHLKQWNSQLKFLRE